MTNLGNEFIQLALSTLSRRPVVTALVVFLVAFGMAAFAVWHGTSGNSNPQRTEFLYLVRISADVALTKGNQHAKINPDNCNLGDGRRFTAAPV